MPREQYQIAQSPNLQSVIVELNNILADLSIRLNFIANDGDNVSLTNTKITNLAEGTEDTDALNLSQIVQKGSTDLTANRLVQTDSSTQLASVLDLTNYLIGTSNQITITNTTGGKATFSLPQNIDTSADVEFDSLILDDLTALQVVSADVNKKLISSGVTTANLVTLTDDSMADTLHRHSELSASDGTPNPALSVDAAGDVTIVGNLTIPVTAISPTVGVIYSGANTLFHIYGTDNFFIGQSGNFTLTVANAIRNTAIGNEALINLTTGYRNVGIGIQACKFITTGYDNLAIGSQAIGYGVGSNIRNIAIGTLALYGITDGNQLACSDNIAIGNNALQHAYFATKSIYIGSQCGLGQGATSALGVIGDRNTFIGYKAGFALGSAGYANYNVCIGADVAASLTGGDSCIIIGRGADVSGGSVTNEIAIGDSLTGLGSNSVVIGNDSITKTVLKGNVGIAVTTPTARLHLPAGVATASGAPVKFTTGVLLTTPEAGVMEFDGTGIYLTNTNHRRFISQASDSIISTVTATTVASTTLWTGITNADELKAYRVYHVQGCGLVNNVNAAGVATITINFGATTIITFTTPGAKLTNDPYHFEATVTVRTTGAGGTVSAFGMMMVNAVTGSKTTHVVTESIAVDTTIANNITVKNTWSAANAANWLKLTQCWLAIAD
jgi:hypothetical protein